MGSMDFLLMASDSNVLHIKYLILVINEKRSLGKNQALLQGI